MKCFLCGRDYKFEDIGSDIEKNPALKLGNKAICIGCLHSLNILLKQIGISAKRGRM
jgi:hypothetical protein